MSWSKLIFFLFFCFEKHLFFIMRSHVINASNIILIHGFRQNLPKITKPKIEKNEPNMVQLYKRRRMKQLCAAIDGLDFPRFTPQYLLGVDSNVPNYSTISLVIDYSILPNLVHNIS